MSIVRTNPQVLKWAREQSGYQAEEVARRLNRKTVTAQTVLNWEKGEKFPSYSQLENLAYKIYKRPLAIFFFSEPPDESDIKKSFRTLPESVDSLDPNMRLILRKARVMQLNLIELHENKISEKTIFKNLKFTLSSSIKNLSKKVRNYLDIDITKQKKWESPKSEEALKQWREAVQSCGVFVFKDSFKESDFSGFCLYDQNFPIIYINNNEAKTRQIFTLFHELAHILFHTSGFHPLNENYFSSQLKGENQKIETKCNEFAGAFLVPDESLPETIELKDIKKLANDYSVSQEVFLRRLLEKKIISNTTYNQLKETIMEEYQSSKKKKTKGGNYYAIKGTYLGDKYISLVYEKYKQKKISSNQLPDFLDAKLETIAQMSPFKQELSRG